MKTKHPKFPPTEWKKGETIPCPSGKCQHRHVRKTGPCTHSGCGCHGKATGLPAAKRQKERSHG